MEGGGGWKEGREGRVERRINSPGPVWRLPFSVRNEVSAVTKHYWLSNIHTAPSSRGSGWLVTLCLPLQGCHVLNQRTFMRLTDGLCTNDITGGYIIITSLLYTCISLIAGLK